MKTIDDQINEVLKLAGVEQLNEGKFSNFCQGAAVLSCIGMWLLGGVEKPKDALADVQQSQITCQEESNGVTVKCESPKGNYIIQTNNDNEPVINVQSANNSKQVALNNNAKLKNLVQLSIEDIYKNQSNPIADRLYNGEGDMVSNGQGKFDINNPQTTTAKGPNVFNRA